MTAANSIKAWMMTEPGKPLEEAVLPWPEVPSGDVVVQVAGCGVCHTDISFLYQGVQTRAESPLVLGHEITGVVVEVGSGVDPKLMGQPVLIPAVMPCGECDLCQSGHRRICRDQIMPGNDRHGGFASHVVVPATYLCPVGEDVLADHELWELAVVADAITTPFQAARRTDLAEGELAIIIGAGGIGIHAVQIAAAIGAKVIALDVDAAKLEAASTHGADVAIDVTDLSMKEIRARVKEEAKAMKAPRFCWKIFESSGTRAGQEAAFALLGFGGVLAVVGFTLDRLELRLSNLMAFDAAVVGNWGCDPVLYPEVLQWIADKRLRVKPFVEHHPLDTINEVFEAAHHGKLARRAVMVP
jgi:6-hydroxycyclohex-1-ene-1-carbonyl-CoA dehydrogenase